MLPLDEFVVLDTETTGCHFAEDRITEVALYYIKNNEIIHQWQSLINPRRAIPGFIQNMTGITDALVKNAPSFAEVAEYLFEQLNGRILIAHNARFDYGFLKNEFKRCGFDYRAKTLCTVKLSKRLFPHEKQHNLDVISQRFKIIPKIRHRAMADAEILLGFLQCLSQQIAPYKLTAEINECLKISSLPASISWEFINKIPKTAGVYQFYNDNNALLYIGKSVSLYDRVRSHFSADHTSTKESRMSQQVARIEWTETVGELAALILEAQLIKKHQPIFNKRLRHCKTLCGMKIKQLPGQYHQIELISLKDVNSDDVAALWTIFKNKRQAQETLHALVKDYGICAKHMGLEKTKGACFQYQLNNCRGACVNKITPEEHNQQLEQALQPLKIQAWEYQEPLVIEEKCSKTQAVIFHLIDKWCYLGSASSREKLKKLGQQARFSFDFDVYKILVGYLSATSLIN